MQTRTYRAATAALVLATTAGCSAPMSSEELDGMPVESSEEGLFTDAEAVNYFATGTIPYCYFPADASSPQPGSADWNSTVTTIEAALLKYERAEGAAINFTGGAQCPSGDFDGIKFRIVDKGAQTSGRQVTFGLGYWLPE